MIGLQVSFLGDFVSQSVEVVYPYKYMLFLNHEVLPKTKEKYLSKLSVPCFSCLHVGCRVR